MSPAAVQMLLELLEQPDPVLSGGVVGLDPTATELITSGLLLGHDSESVAASMADYDDVPVSLTWSEKARGLTYFSRSVGPVAIDHDQLRRWHVDVAALLAAIVVDLDLLNKPTFELIDGLLWEVSDARIGRRTKRVSIWFTRRLGDRRVQQQVAGAVRARPHQRQRVILTSSSPDQIGNFNVAGAVIVPLQDVLARPDTLAIDAEILGARLSGVTAIDVEGPVILSPDGTQLRINGGDPIRFRSVKHIAAIRQFVEAYQAGRRLRAVEVTETGNFSSLFGREKWKTLRPFFRTIDGLWALEP